MKTLRSPYRIPSASCLAWGTLVPLLLWNVWASAASPVTVEHEPEATKARIQGEGWSLDIDKQQGRITVTSGGQEVALVPLDDAGNAADRVENLRIAEQPGPGGAQLDVAFSAQGNPMAAALHVSPQGTLTVKPGGGLAAIRVQASVAIGLLPGIRLEDVLYLPETFPKASLVHVPAENWFAGLLSGGNAILALAWPGQGQRLCLHRQAEDASPCFDAIDISLAAEELYLELLAAPALWFRRELALQELEKDVPLEWQPPFSAAYKTQLPIKAETTTGRSFVFRSGRQPHYWPEVGSLIWPVWFDQGKPWIHTSKKVPPQGAMIAFPFDQGSKTLMGFIGRTPLASLIAERNARAPLPHGPHEAPNVGFVACGGTFILRNTIYSMGLQQREQAFLKEHIRLLADYVAIVQKKNAAYGEFLKNTEADLVKWQQDGQEAPELDAYLERMRARMGEAAEGYARKMEFLGGKTPEEHTAHAERAAERLRVLLACPGPELSPECDELVETLNQLSWAHDEAVGMRISMSARAWAQEAALACAHVPAAVQYATAIRKAIRDALNGAPPW